MNVQLDSVTIWKIHEFATEWQMKVIHTQEQLKDPVKQMGEYVLKRLKEYWKETRKY